MPFLAQEHYAIPNKDLLTWMFDDRLPYDADKEVYIDAADPSRSISCRQAKTIVRRLAAGFRKAGLRKGDCVCLMAFNDIFYSMAFLGIVAAGGVFTGLNPSYTVHELTHAIRTADITYMLVEPDFLPKAIQAAKDCAIPVQNLFSFDVLSPDPDTRLKVRSWRTLQVEEEETDWERFDDETLSRKTTAARLFSSGTTGLPKALDLSVWNLVSQHMLVMEVNPRPYEVPRAHTSVIRAGQTSYVMRRFELEPWLDNISKYSITEVNIVPMMVMRLLSSGHLESGKYSLNSLRNAWAGSAPLDRSIQSRFKEYLQPGTPFNQAWGMSETTCLATWFHYPEEDSTGSVGRLLPNCDAKIVDDKGQDISGLQHQNGGYVHGELCVQGPIIVEGYYKNEEANSRDWDKDRYFHTSDIAYCDVESRKWYIVDRKRELIKVRGFQVSPTELEGVLLLHPNIIDCAVIGVRRSKDESELPRAYIVRRSGTTITEVDVRDFTKDRLSGYKQLDGGIKFIDVLPRNANGKVQKVELRRAAMRQQSARL